MNESTVKADFLFYLQNICGKWRSFYLLNTRFDFEKK
jgi:hypothetical protein